jgi:hypothetical protein
MMRRPPSLGLAIIVLIVFVIASVINVWLLLERGPTPLRVIAAAGFIIATVGWLFVVARARRGSDQ